MPSYLRLSLILVSLFAWPLAADEQAGHPVVVIDTDMGLDDAVTLAMALQHPEMEIAAIIAAEGAAGREASVSHLEKMLDLFNRKDIRLYAPLDTKQARPSPPFRPFAERAIGSALPNKTKSFHRSFSPDAYAVKGKKVVVLVLGPLTNLATALKARPEIAQDISKIIVAGPADGWNMVYDSPALDSVKATGPPIEFVVPGPAGTKPDAWAQGNIAIGQGTSIGEEFFKHLLTDPPTRKHYLEQHAGFHDELAFIYCTNSSPFSGTARQRVFVPSDRRSILELFTGYLSSGRQHKPRVVFTEAAFPDDVFQPDIKQRKARIIAKNGEDEWLAQLLMNELHEHLGAYSIIGVKMGMRAAELLNAPQHGMKVLSRTAPQPPVSCLNDGIIVSTGCTPGRMLFRHEPGPAGCVDVLFSCNGRRLTLTLKDDYRRKIKDLFQDLLAKYTTEDQAYWKEVRQAGLDIWENWHRRDLFQIVAVEDVTVEETEQH